MKFTLTAITLALATSALALPTEQNSNILERRQSGNVPPGGLCGFNDCTLGFTCIFAAPGESRCSRNSAVGRFCIEDTVSLSSLFLTSTHPYTPYTHTYTLLLPFCCSFNACCLLCSCEARVSPLTPAPFSAPFNQYQLKSNSNSNSKSKSENQKITLTSGISHIQDCGSFNCGLGGNGNAGATIFECLP